MVALAPMVTRGGAGACRVDDAAAVVRLLSRKPGQSCAPRVLHDAPCRRVRTPPAVRRRGPALAVPLEVAPRWPHGPGAKCLEAKRCARQLPARHPTGHRPAAARGASKCAVSLDSLLAAVTGVARHALRWALREARDGPLIPERCHHAAQVMFAAR